MPTYSASSADMNVVRAAYAAASPLTQDPKILQALFEAAMVESNFHNPTKATDHDSLGYLQQRPSQGWPDPTNITTATKSFIQRAVANSKSHPSYSAGQLAQSVQRSAYPDRYDQASGAALQLLAKVKTGGLGGYDPNPTLTIPGLTGADPLGAVADAIRSAAAPLVEVGKLADLLGKAFLPTNFVRLVSGVFGALFIVYAVVLLAKEVKNA